MYTRGEYLPLHMHKTSSGNGVQSTKQDPPKLFGNIYIIRLPVRVYLRQQDRQFEIPCIPYQISVMHSLGQRPISVPCGLPRA